MPEAHAVIARFKEQFRAFVGTSVCTLTFPNAHGYPHILWDVYAASCPQGAPSERHRYSFYPGDVVELTEHDDGLLTESVQIGNYGPPEIRNTYRLRVSDRTCIWSCDDNDFDLVTREVHFRVRARSPETLEQVAQALVNWHTARGAALLRRVDEID